nr:phenylalanine--tRNA ligase beta subunit-related protein [Kineosporia babensis]
MYTVSPDVFERAPEFERAVVIISDVENSRPAEELEVLFRQRLKEIEDDPTLTAGDPRIEAWIAAYRLFPSPQGQRIRPSISSLVRRIKKGGSDRIPFISPLVAISNLVSLEYFTPSGLIDADSVTGNLILGPATGNESFTPFGRDEESKIEPGEIIYYDDDSKTVLCRAWNSQGGKATGIQPSTRHAVLDVDCLLPVLNKEELNAASAFAADLAQKYCSARSQVFTLNASNPSFEFTF